MHPIRAYAPQHLLHIITQFICYLLPQHSRECHSRAHQFLACHHVSETLVLMIPMLDILSRRIQVIGTLVNDIFLYTALVPALFLSNLHSRSCALFFRALFSFVRYSRL